MKPKTTKKPSSKIPKIDVFNIKGEKTGSLSLPKEIFAAKINPQLMAQAVRVYLSNQRRAGAKTKTRAEVSGSGRKIWRQKGTGRARHGDMYAPIFVGGGVAHGPTGKENFKLKMSQKMKRKALFSALTSKFQAGEIVAVKGLEKMKPKTKEMVKILEKLKLKTKNLKALIVLSETVENIIRPARNIKGVNLTQANFLNTYEVLNAGKLVFMKKSVDKLKEVFLKENGH